MYPTVLGLAIAENLEPPSPARLRSIVAPTPSSTALPEALIEAADGTKVALMTDVIPGELCVEIEEPNDVLVPKAREDLEPF